MTHFYKYVTPSTGRAILEKGTLRWATPPTLNDPFDMQFAFQLRVDRDAVRRAAADKQWDHCQGRLLDKPPNRLGKLIRALPGAFTQQTREQFEATFQAGFDESFAAVSEYLPSLNADIRKMVSRDKIFCVSAVPDNILMWSYYAENHSGVVLRFDSNVHESPLSEALEVEYVDHFPSIYDEETLSDILAGYGDLNRDWLLKAVVLTKYRPWAHEAEWRVYSGRGRISDAFEYVPFNPQELDGLILGARLFNRGAGDGALARSG